MLCKTLVDEHYKDVPALCDAIAEVLAAQVARFDCDIVQIDEANLPGHPDEWDWAAAAINKVLKAVKSTPAVHLCFGNYGGQQPQHGTWAKLMDYLNALHVDHIVMENAHRPAEELVVFKDLRPEIGTGPRRAGRQVDGGRKRRGNRRHDRALREHHGRRARALHPPGLRVVEP